MVYDVIIIGSGPAGISAALYTKRANLNVLVVSLNNSTLLRAEKIENYYGLEEPIDGERLYKIGLKQINDLDIEIKEEQVLEIIYDSNLTVQTNENDYKSKVVIIATGVSSKTINIKGLKELEGKGVSYCATCDGFFYKNKNVGVLGSGEYALHEANHLKGIASNVTIFTNGKELEFNDNEFELNKNEIQEIVGNNKIEKIVFKNSESIEIEGLFVAYGKAGGFEFAKKIGALIENNRIVVNENMGTNIPGLYACGDVTGGLLQISKAVYEGAKAGTEAAKYIRKNKKDS